MSFKVEGGDTSWLVNDWKEGVYKGGKMTKDVQDYTKATEISLS